MLDKNGNINVKDIITLSVIIKKQQLSVKNRPKTGKKNSEEKNNNNETKEKVDFELANILDIDGLTCPTRKVYNNTCHWQYRGCGCNYGKFYGYSTR